MSMFYDNDTTKLLLSSESVQKLAQKSNIIRIQFIDHIQHTLFASYPVIKCFVSYCSKPTQDIFN